MVDLPIAVDGCTCLCHRQEGVVHFVACCGISSLSTPTTPPPAAETRLRDVLSLADAEKIAGDKPNAHHDNCTCDDCMYYMSRVDGVQLGYAAALTQPEPTAQQATTYQSAADCPLGSAHGTASTHGNADGVQCCDWCGFPVSAQQGGEEAAVHMADCNQGEYAGECKYGDSDCPALSAQQAAGEAVDIEAADRFCSPVDDPILHRLMVKAFARHRTLYAAPQPEAPAEVKQGVAWLYTKPKCFNIIRYQGERGLHVPEGFTETPLFATPQQGQEVEAEVVATCERLAARMGGRYVLRANDASDPQSAAAPADRDILHLARILEEWDMKPWPNDHTGHSYEDIARDALTRLALPAAASVEAGERAQIVGWLRGEAEMRDRLADDHPTIDGVRYNKNRAIALHMAVEAIERGDHLADKGKDQADG